ncbi:hypothetical protein QSP58_09130 [Clostridioides difficile]|nr:hypothetical protein [Clostridioides difficile]MDM9721520.1 hypothetical protein [Clostridioides difficile]
MDDWNKFHKSEDKFEEYRNNSSTFDNFQLNDTPFLEGRSTVL